MNDLNEFALLLHVASAVFMTGLIWFIQIVHYPLKSFVGADTFVQYQAAHVQRTGWVVIVPMLLEASTGLWLLWSTPPEGQTVLLWVSFLLLIKVWVVTAVYSVPAHNRLSNGFDRNAHRLLVGTNWFRTFGWSMRSLLLLWYLSTTVQWVGS